MPDDGPSSDDKADGRSRAGTAPATARFARLRTVVGTLSTGEHPTFLASTYRFRQSKELLVLARQVSLSTRTNEDSAWLARKSIYLLFLAVLAHHGETAASYDECVAKIRDRDVLRGLFADLLDQLAFVDDLVESFDVVLDETSRHRERYERLLASIAAAHKRARSYLDGEISKAGGHPALGRYVWVVALLGAAALVVWLVASVLSGPEPPVAEAVAPPPPPPAAPAADTPRAPGDAPRATPSVDPRPPEVKGLPGADEPLRPLRPAQRDLLKMEQVASSFFRRYALRADPGRYVVQIEARGTSCEQLEVPEAKRTNPWPAIEVYLDAGRLKRWYVDSTSGKRFTTEPVELSGGEHTVELFFTNDYVDGDRCDRNVVLEWVEVVPADS